MHRIAVISDTHNLLRPEVVEIIRTCEVIVHAGDISTLDILDRLEELKPLYIVRGNNDRGDWASGLPQVLTFDLFGRTVCMTHIKRNIPPDHKADLVIYGHSHRYSCARDGDAVFLNPGSCGPRRFNQEITMAILTLTDEKDQGDEKAKEDILAPEMAEGIFVERIDIPHEAPAGKGGARGGQDMKSVLRTTLGVNSGSGQNSGQSTGQSSRQNSGQSSQGGPFRSSSTYKRAVTTDIIRRVCEDVDRERTVQEIAARRRIDPELAEQIVRMYLTHQKVTPEQIMTKLGL